jgi:translation initiation factor IF-2
MTEAAATRRLNKVAVEFNVSIATIVEFLESKGYELEAKPTTKVPEEAYEVLLQKFQPDKLAKQKSDSLKLTPLINKEEKQRHAEHEAARLAAESKPKEVQPAEPEQEEEVKAPEPLPEEVEPPKEAKEIKEESPVLEEESKEEESVQFKVVGKMDLDSLKRGKKGKASSKARQAAPKKDEEQPGTEETSKPQEKPAEAPAPVMAEEESISVLSKEESAELAEKVVEKLEEVSAGKEVPAKKEKEEEKKGLTIVGKLDLEQFNRKKKPLASTDDLSTMKKKRRKRKPIGEGERPQGGNRNQPHGPGQGLGQGQGNRPPARVTPGHVQSTMQRSSQEMKEQDEKRIQDEIKKTLSRLSQKTGHHDARSKVKRKKREDRRNRIAEEESHVEGNVIQVTEFITANELSSLLNVPVNKIIMACMSLGLMVSINQRLDAETITIVADEFGYEVEFKDAEMDEPALEEPDEDENMVQRAPIVTIMGHVDHGKTSLLDFIRNTNVVAGEAGGITQHIGAYEVKLENGKRITFLDTPGHEAFTAMRARGAKVTDLAIIVIAADDSVMPQTREAISHAQAAGVPIVFAFNKIDKDGANPQRIREQLAELNILVEEWGGKYQTQEISAKKGLNVDLLLDKVLLEAEILDLKADPSKRAVGTVIEASLDKGRGIVATLLVEKGTLHVGDPILAGANNCKVRAMYNERGQRVTSAGPAAPVQVLGFDGAPTAGDKFYVTESEQVAREMSTKRKQLIREQGIRTKKHITLDEIGRRLAIGNFRELNVIIKGDVDGSVEALADSLEKLSTEEIYVRSIFKGVGQISESDVLLASASDAIIIGFQVRPSVSARKLAEQEQIDIRLYSVIYNAIEEVKSAMEGMLAPTQEEKITGNVEVRDVFKISKVGTVAGCQVLDGKVTRNSKIRLVRDGVVVFSGELDSLKRHKDDVKEVATGYECGLTIHNFNDIKVGDIIECYEIVSIARKL